ncbi:Putative tyrosinase copper-binding domain, di-copper centre-containing domain superfamily, tyosinase [Septoria linicola]|uniref:tyrosinase n=1 Tax=Septoria linicola TaxID=215465 RepID=A0A9Q9AWR3_9PEZI|nr:Putative tyrosinase copper-binding domain, di-copper centre-containing domain superfamily, tyosinase [Septoria linicola]
MLNIFLLGLARFQATPQEGKYSYYRICAIHGRPFGPWDNVQPANGTEDNGYCTHVSNLLLPWHRPYLALFEQLLFEHIVECVNEFPPGELRQRYAQAAMLVRLPFWDWAVKPENGSVWPEIVQQPRIQVVMPNGTTTIDNPLFSYKFRPISSRDMQLDPFASWQQTLRYPNAQTSNAKSQNDRIGIELENQQVNYQNRIYNLLTFYDNFTQFGNEAWIGDEENVDSLEALHDAIHGNTGKDGHMTYLDFSAYDPIFWLHHVCLDRFWAIWQILHPDSFVEPMAAYSDTFTYKEGSIQDANSPLNPFSRDRIGTKWTPNTVRDTRTFGYTYPETQTGNQADTKAQVNKLYGEAFDKGSHISRRDKAATAQGAKVAAGFEVDGRQRHYTASLLSNKHALNGSYAIYVFVGDFNETDPCTWPTSPNLAGTHAIFTSLHPGNSVSRPSIVTGGEVPLTNILLNKASSGDLSSLDEESVESFLKDNLHWRVATFNDQAVPTEDVSDLEIIVTMTEVTPAATEHDLPTRQNFKKLASITKDRPGGC